MSSAINSLVTQFSSVTLCDEKSSSITVLRDYLSGSNVDSYMEFLADVLSDRKPKKFFGFSQQEMLANIFLFVMHYRKTGNEKYLHLFLAAVPYYFSSIESLKTDVFDADLDDIESAIKRKDPAADELISKSAASFASAKTPNFIPYDVAMFSFKCFVRAFVKHRCEELFDVCAERFVNWSRLEQVENEVLIKVFTFYAKALGNAKLEFFTSICKQKISPYLQALLTVEVTKIEPLLARAKNGECVEAELNYLASYLFGEEKPRYFSRYSAQDKWAFIELLEMCWKKTGNQHYVTLMLYAIPYMGGDLDAIHLSIGPIDRAHLVDAVARWYDYEAPSTAQAVKMIRFFSSLVVEKKDFHIASCHFLIAFASSVERIKNMPQLLFGLTQTGSFSKNDFEWTLSLNDDEREALVYILNLPNFPMDKREQYFSYLLSEDIVTASRLLEQLPLPRICQLFEALSERDDNELCKSCFPHIAKGIVHSRVKNGAIAQLGKRPELLGEFFLYVVSAVQKPDENTVGLLQTFGQAIRSEDCYNDLRLVYLEQVLKPQIPPYFYLIALYMLKPSDKEQLSQFLKNIQKSESIKETIIALINAQELNAPLKNGCMNILLEERNGASFLLAVQLAGDLLSLSVVRKLLKEAIKLKEHEDVQAALSLIMRADWHNDTVRKENNPEWFREKSIKHIPEGFFEQFSRKHYRPTWYTHYDLNVYTEDDEVFHAFAAQLAVLGIETGREKLKKVILCDFACTKLNRRKEMPRYNYFLTLFHKKAKPQGKLKVR